MESLTKKEKLNGFKKLGTVIPAEFNYNRLHETNLLNLKKYDIMAWFYDILDFPWELKYRRWRPGLVGDLRGDVLEAGIGTGRNLKHYHHEVDLTALDFSHAMLRRSMKRARDARCKVTFVQEDACSMESIAADRYDWVLATFICCVIPEELQHQVIRQFARVLKPGGRFRLLEMIYSKQPSLKKRQDFFAPFVERVYGARFDRNTIKHVEEAEKLKITGTRFLKNDTYLMIEGVRED